MASCRVVERTASKGVCHELINRLTIHHQHRGRPVHHFLSRAWPLSLDGLQPWADRQGGAWTSGIIGRFPWLILPGAMSQGMAVLQDDGRLSITERCGGATSSGS